MKRALRSQSKPVSVKIYVEPAVAKNLQDKAENMKLSLRKYIEAIMKDFCLCHKS